MVLLSSQRLQGHSQITHSNFFRERDGAQRLVMDFLQALGKEKLEMKNLLGKTEKTGKFCILLSYLLYFDKVVKIQGLNLHKK